MTIKTMREYGKDRPDHSNLSSLIGLRYKDYENLTIEDITYKGLF